MRDWRSQIESALEHLGMPAAQQRDLDFPPEELRLGWEDGFAPLGGKFANLDAVACFHPAQLAALNDFNDYLWHLPPEPDPMWHRDHLDDPVWSEVRRRAVLLLQELRLQS